MTECVILGTINHTAYKKPIIADEIIDISDDCDSNASTVIDASELGTVNDIDTDLMIQTTNAEKVISEPKSCSNGSLKFDDFSLKSSDDFYSNDNGSMDQSEDMLNRIQISKVESLSVQTDKVLNDNKLLIFAEEKQNLISKNSCGMNLKIKEETPDFDHDNLKKFSIDENAPEPNFDIVWDLLPKYFPYVELQNIPELLCNINTSQAFNKSSNSTNPLAEQNSQQNDNKKKRRVFKVAKRKKVCEEKRYKCPFCSFADAQKDPLMHHLYLHVNEQLTCHICRKKFNERNSLVDHIIFYHGFCSPNYRTCSLCSTLLTDRYNLELHLDAHKKDGFFPCNICCYKAKALPSLKDHLNRHADQQRCFCNDCGRSFLKKHKLAEHLDRYKHQRHSKKKKYQCEKCNGVYKRSYHFLRHVSNCS